MTRFQIGVMAAMVLVALVASGQQGCRRSRARPYGCSWVAP